MNRIDILILTVSSAASCAIGAAVAHKRTKKNLTEFFEKQIAVEIAAALHIQAEQINAIHLTPYRPEGLFVGDIDVEISPEFREAEKPQEVVIPVPRGDGKIPYHTYAQIDTERHTVISGGVLTRPKVVMQEDNELDFADLEMVGLENTNRKVQGLSHVITYEECTDEVQGYTSAQLVYYENDGVLADYVHEVYDIDETIDEFNLNLFGYLADGDVVYIRNPKKMLLIEVARDTGAFAEAKGKV